MKTSAQFHLNPVRNQITTNAGQDVSWGGGEKPPFTGGGSAMWCSTVWRFFKTQEIELRVPGLHCQAFNRRNLYSTTDTCSLVFVTAINTAARKWNRQASINSVCIMNTCYVTRCNLQPRIKVKLRNLWINGWIWKQAHELGCSGIEKRMPGVPPQMCVQASNI